MVAKEVNYIARYEILNKHNTDKMKFKILNLKGNDKRVNNSKIKSWLAVQRFKILQTKGTLSNTKALSTVYKMHKLLKSRIIKFFK